MCGRVLVIVDAILIEAVLWFQSFSEVLAYAFVWSDELSPGCTCLLMIL